MTITCPQCSSPYEEPCPRFCGRCGAVLRRVAAKRTLGDLSDADVQTLSGTQLPADPLVPIGYERKDTTPVC